MPISQPIELTWNEKRPSRYGNGRLLAEFTAPIGDTYIAIPHIQDRRISLQKNPEGNLIVYGSLADPIDYETLTTNDFVIDKGGFANVADGTAELGLIYMPLSIIRLNVTVSPCLVRFEI